MTEVDLAHVDVKKPPQLMRAVLREQLVWLIRLRWFAVAGLVAMGLVCTYLFRVIDPVHPLYACAGILLLFNIAYYTATRMHKKSNRRRDIILAMFQVEVDLIILTALIHFSGGISNPFILFYVFHVIIATIILPGALSFAVGISCIAMFGLMAVGEMNEWWWMRHYPFEFSSQAGLWKNEVYVLGTFTAFVLTVVLARYLTRTIISRMTEKEFEAARNHDVLKAVIHGMREGLLFVTNSGKITICNPAASMWTTDDSIHIGQREISDFPEALAEHIRYLLSGKNTGETIQGPIHFETPGKEKDFIEAHSCTVQSIDGTGLGYVIVGEDLTEHKKLEHELRERTEETEEINEMLKKSRIEMAQREKMVAIGQMASGIAHEIGNPLASLSSVAQYLKRNTTDAKQTLQLGIIETQIDRISRILKRMLTLARPATSEYKWTDVNTVIDGVVSLIRFDRRAKNIEIITEPNPDMPMVWLNPLSFEQVLLNVMVNALDAISIAKKREDGHSIEITRTFENEMIEVRIKDTGIGMEPEVCRRAFESFFTTKEIGKGTGLGLFISYNLMTEIDGTINMESMPGEGATIILRIPIRPKKHLINCEEAANED